METPPGPATRPRRLVSERWLLLTMLVITGIGLVALASTFLLAETGLGSASASHQRDGGQPAAPPASSGQRLFDGLFLLAAAAGPPPTSTPAATATPIPTVAEQAFSPRAPAASQPAAPPAAPADPPAAPPSPPSTGCPTASMSGFALDLFNAINNERTSRGMAALAADGCVVYIAQLRSNDMASRGYFSHTSPDGSTAFSLMDGLGVPFGWAGENLARNNYSDDQTVGVAIHDLMASPGHRDNILGPNYTNLGVAAVNDGTGMWYYTMVFVGPP